MTFSFYKPSSFLEAFPIKIEAFNTIWKKWLFPSIFLLFFASIRNRRIIEGKRPCTLEYFNFEISIPEISYQLLLPASDCLLQQTISPDLSPQKSAARDWRSSIFFNISLVESACSFNVTAESHSVSGIHFLASSQPATHVTNIRMCPWWKL